MVKPQNITYIHTAQTLFLFKEQAYRDFPGGPVVENPSCNIGDTCSIPGWGTKIPHAVGQLSPRATTKEPERHNYRAHALWSLGAATKTQYSQKTNK